MEAGTKQFRKRNAILDCLRASRSHPSADSLFQALHADHPDISLATVYRNLALFKQQGLIASVGTVDGIERFDGNPEPHTHFICSGCGAVTDLHHVAPPAGLIETAGRDSGCRIDSCQLVFNGLCRDCLETGNNIL